MHNDTEDRDRWREDAHNYFDSTTGDDLSRMATEMEHLRDYLLGLFRFNKIDQHTVGELIAVEEAVQALLQPRWDACQGVLLDATSEQLEEMDTDWMGKDMPSHFRGMTVESLKAMATRRPTRPAPTNPATLIATGDA